MQWLLPKCSQSSPLFYDVSDSETCERLRKVIAELGSRLLIKARTGREPNYLERLVRQFSNMAFDQRPPIFPPMIRSTFAPRELGVRT